jgi:dihydropteroate synthase
MRASELAVRGRTVALGGRPLVMGVLNASPESFSDPGERTVADQLARARAMVRAGASILDVGGESARTDQPALDPEEEIARVVPLVTALRRELDVLVSVDTYKAPVAEAVLAAGADVVNDISGLRDPGLAELCARAGAGLVVAHNPGVPKVRALSPAAYGDVVAEVLAFLRERLAVARELGVAPASLVVDPGPDLHKTPAQTVEVLRALDRVVALGHPVLLAVSRKDFVGTITGRAPAARGPGTLAAIDDGVRRGAAILRVHDVAATAAFLAARGG